MKKHLSVFCLLIRMKLKRALIFITLIPVVSILTYKFFFLGVTEVEPGSFQIGKAYLTTYIPFLVGSLGVAWSCIDLRFGKSKQRYFLARLRISERAVFGWEAVTVTLIFLLLWQVEIITLAAQGLMHNSSEWNTSGSMDVIMAIYLREFYQSVIPMASLGLWFRNISYLLCTGLACACINMYPGDSASRVLGIVGLIIPAVFYTSGFSTEGTFFSCLLMFIAVYLTDRRLHNGKARGENEEMDC